ncbi:tetratricopeptide repeat protein [Aquimarina algicola]|uniref:Tetratricopeptide repeat protein n=1 Tax=Aquimarina algicola TaxID=2589995 RepID=A0A504IXP7_9FLAO|nr:tetratricopeptide repeat protein [Aquimarina algicola]TPN82834.1 tetratricopeptide repeat protein [Aquimarina algicola]
MKKNDLIYLLLLFFSYNLVVYSQNQHKIDSILSIISTTQNDTIIAANYIKLGDLTMYNNPEQAKVYIENSLALYKKTNFSEGLAKSYVKKATYFYVKSQKDSIQYYLDKSIHLYLTLGDTIQAAGVRYNLGIIHLAEGDYKKCLDIMEMNIPIFEKAKDSVRLGSAYLMKGKVAMVRGYYNIALKETYIALKIHENIKDNVRIAEDLFQIGKLYDDLQKHKKAISIYHDCYKLYEDLDYIQPKSQVLSFMGHSYLRIQNYDAARESLEKSLQLSKETNYTANIARTHVNLGTLEYELDNYNTSIEYLQEGIKLWKYMSNPHNEANTKLKIGKTYLAKKEYTIAARYFNQCIRIADSIESLKLQADAYQNRAISFEKLGHYKEAYQDHKKSKTISDTLLNLKRTKAIEELNIIYETEKKEQQIENQNSAIKILEQESKIKNLQQIILMITLLIGSLIFGFGIYKIRKKMKQHLQEKRTLNTALHNTKKELTVKTLYLAKKNNVLENLKEEAISANTQQPSEQKLYKKLVQTINFDLKDDDNWENFRKYFEEIHEDFYSTIKKKYPTITAKELRLIALLKLNLTSKEIGTLLNISADGVKKARYRLRKKMNLTTKESLQDHITKM